VLNQSAYTQAPILAVGGNFGCGSSREHAVWALAEWGVRAIIGESFAPIFQQNCLRNGLLPVMLAKAAIAALAGKSVTIDLAAQTVRSGESVWPFSIDAEARTMLLEGLDAIDLTLISLPEIESWTAADRASRPWAYLEKAS
jgi:3-isopropylmalate/(R)-2-methylmalate dehydratase small subunit